MPPCATQLPMFAICFKKLCDVFEVLDRCAATPWKVSSTARACQRKKGAAFVYLPVVFLVLGVLLFKESNNHFLSGCDCHRM